MRQVLDGKNYDDGKSFLDALNRERLKAAKGWFFYTGRVADKDVAIKSYGVGYLQILRVNGVNHPTVMDMNVGQWKAAILRAVS